MMQKFPFNVQILGGKFTKSDYFQLQATMAIIFGQKPLKSDYFRKRNQLDLNLMILKINLI